MDKIDLLSEFVIQAIIVSVGLVLIKELSANLSYKDTLAAYFGMGAFSMLYAVQMAYFLGKYQQNKENKINKQE